MRNPNEKPLRKCQLSSGIFLGFVITLGNEEAAACTKELRNLLEKGTKNNSRRSRNAYV